MAFTYPQNHFKSESARCEACGNPDGNEIRFNDEVLYLHCVGCKSETAGAALLSANKEIGRLRQSISDSVPVRRAMSERMELLERERDAALEKLAEAHTRVSVLERLALDTKNALDVRVEYAMECRELLREVLVQSREHVPLHLVAAIDAALAKNPAPVASGESTTADREPMAQAPVSANSAGAGPNLVDGPNATKSDDDLAGHLHNQPKE